MAGRWHQRSAFRADPASAPSTGPSPRQTLALISVLVMIAAAVAVASYVVRPEKARAFDLFHGSIFLNDQTAPVAVDLASGKPTLRLLGADAQVGITGAQRMAVVPLTDHTLLLNTATGEFNMVDNGGFIVKHDGGGVPLVKRSGTTTSFGVAADNGQAYIVRTGSTGGTDVYLVSQPTVEAAIGARGSVRPRASGSMPEAGSTAPGGAVSANGDLWLLVGGTSAAGTHTIRRLTLPPNSSAGATLTPSDEGRVTGPAAIGTAVNPSDGTGATTVGAASAGRITLFTPGSASAQTPVRYRAPAGVDTVLPVSGGAGRLAFLLHGSAGWYVVSVAADGTTLRGPSRLTAIPRGATLAEPATGSGRLYTIDKAGGGLFDIGYDGSAQLLPGPLPTYPIAMSGDKPGETPDLSDAYVISDGPRVIFNSPDHASAVMVFTDGSHSPRLITKSAAVAVNAAAGAEALTRSSVPPTQPGKNPPPGQHKPKPPAVQPVNNKIDCKTATQKPHIPVITSTAPGSRSVALTWTYPTFDVQDCYPSTYIVSVDLTSNGAPQPPASVTVQSQTGVNLTGLFPSSRYLITVTAVINGQSTPSDAVPVRTGAEGPAAPTAVKVSADSAGNWQLSWNSCGTVQQGCVPAQSWTITPRFCDGRGVSTPPPPVTVTADPTSTVQPPAVYRGTDDLLGRGLQFQVQGTGDQGQAGAPSALSACTYSWTPPVAADLAVTASTPPQSPGSTQPTTTTAQVTFKNGQVHDLGGVGGTLTYQLLQNGSVVKSVGPITDPTATLGGVLPGETYQVRVLASPPQHPEVTTTVGPVDVAPAFADWPQVQLDLPTFEAPPGLAGTLHLRFTFPTGSDVRGETFDLVNSTLTCGGGNASMDLTASNVSPGDSLSFPVDRATYNGPCTATVQLVQDPQSATNPPLFGAGPSKAVTSGQVQIDPPSITSTVDDFNAQWGGSIGNPTVIVSYHGGDDLADGGRNWQMTVSNQKGTCGTVNGNPPPTTIDVDKNCIPQGGPFIVSVDYTYFGAQAHFDVPVSGTAPQPVDPNNISFSAAWNTDPNLPQVDLTYTGTQDLPSIAPLKFTESVTSSVSPGVTCGSGTGNPADGPPQISVDLTACPPAAQDGTAAVYTVAISFTDPNYGQTGNYTYTVQGTPPT
ncbi:MAG TPA: fibronectin type III domain-containing protein [Jatrophihabitans sp.]|nr:fibronectin type III domain-containing protein [Jatrophihabitans sp.]